MTVEELKEIAADALKFGLEQVAAPEGLALMFHLVLRSGAVEILIALPDVTNDEDAKRALAGAIRARVEAGEIVAVIMLSDTFFATLTPEAHKIRQAFRMTVEQAAAAGLCEKHEAVMVRLESPIYWLHINQEYTRAGDRIETKGAPVHIDADNGGKNTRSRFTNFWPAPEGTRQ